MKKRLNFIIIAVTLAIVVGYLFFVDGIDNVWNMVTQLKPFWVIMALVCIIVYWLLESLILHLILKKIHARQKFNTSLRASMIGQYFNCVTPFASGGQPMQAMFLTRRGVPFSVTVTALLFKFISYQLMLTVLSLIILIFRYQFFAQKIPGFGFLIVVGFLITSAVIVLLLCIAYFKKATEKVACAIIKFLAKIRLVKNREDKLSRVHKQVEAMYEDFQVIRKNKLMVLKMCLLSCIQLIVFFAIPLMIHQSFGLPAEHVLTIMCAQAFVMMVTSFVPLPGSAGGAEAGFIIFFGSFFPANTISLAMLLWRIITFYLPICVGGFFMMSTGKTPKIVEEVAKEEYEQMKQMADAAKEEEKLHSQVNKLSEE